MNTFTNAFRQGRRAGLASACVVAAAALAMALCLTVLCLQAFAANYDDYVFGDATEAYNLGTIEVTAADAEDGVITLEVGQTATITIDPYLHVHYGGCEMGHCPVSGCGELGCWSDYGCCCLSNPVVHEAAVTATTSSAAVASLSEVVADGELEASDETLGQGVTGTITITANAAGTATVTVVAEDMLFYFDGEIELTVVVVSEGYTGESHTHVAGEAVVADEVAATCTEAGTYDSVVFCSVCGTELSRQTFAGDAATGHDYVLVEEVYDCEEGGYDLYECSVCGDQYTEELAATGHDYAAVVTEPTCTEAGYTTYTCTVCGESYVGDEVAATGHTAGEAVVENEVAATCTEAGSYDSVVYCTVCGEEISRETVATEATGHSYVASFTYGEDYAWATATVYCSRCGLIVAQDAEATVEKLRDGTYWAYIVVDGETYEEMFALASAGDEAYFTDVQDTSQAYYTAIYSLAEAGYVTGRTSTYFDRTGTLSRADMVTVLWRILCPDEYASFLTDDGTYDYSGAASATFADVASGKYYTAAVEWAYAQGITKGTTASAFSPNATCTFEQFCTFVARAINGGDEATSAAVGDDEARALLAATFSDGADVGESFDNSVAFLVQNGVVKGNSDGTLAPGEDVTRQRMANLIYQTIQAGYLA